MTRIFYAGDAAEYVRILERETSDDSVLISAERSDRTTTMTFGTRAEREQRRAEHEEAVRARAAETKARCKREQAQVGGEEVGDGEV